MEIATLVIAIIALLISAFLAWLRYQEWHAKSDLRPSILIDQDDRAQAFPIPPLPANQVNRVNLAGRVAKA